MNQSNSVARQIANLNNMTATELREMYASLHGRDPTSENGPLMATGSNNDPKPLESAIQGGLQPDWDIVAGGVTHEAARSISDESDAKDDSAQTTDKGASSSKEARAVRLYKATSTLETWRSQDCTYYGVGVTWFHVRRAGPRHRYQEILSGHNNLTLDEMSNGTKYVGELFTEDQFEALKDVKLLGCEIVFSEVTLPTNADGWDERHLLSCRAAKRRATSLTFGSYPDPTLPFKVGAHLDFENAKRVLDDPGVDTFKRAADDD